MRYFGKCSAKKCNFRAVRESDKNYNLSSRFGRLCTTHPDYGLDWTPVDATLNLAKECNGRCMASKGPSCECSCGGHNHGAESVAS